MMPKVGLPFITRCFLQGKIRCLHFLTPGPTQLPGQQGEIDVEPSQIHRVTLRTGLIDHASDAEGCPSITFLAPDIPEDILQRFEEDDYPSLADLYGDPSWGSPIQYDHLEVETASGVKRIEIFNRAILLMTHNTEETRRAHRVVQVVEQHMRSGEQAL